MVELKSPKDVRKLVCRWITEACENKKLPFERDGGTIVQLLNVWLRTFETEKVEELTKRVEKLEGAK
ncbi:MAG: hypothetical protein MUO26_10480 [Methanotrichaceae archaeon]|nr:hypothetical protein [Methanotrichaceae archaeon]